MVYQGSSSTMSNRKILVASVALLSSVFASPLSGSQPREYKTMFKFSKLTIWIVSSVYKRGTHSYSRPPPLVGDWSSSRIVRRQEEDVCDTEACKSFANSVIAGRAENYTDVDPCEDFATYTCAGWWASHDFRADQSSELSKKEIDA